MLLNRHEIARVLLGLIFVVMGLNWFLNFLPAPALSTEGLKFIQALIETGYLMTLVKGLEVVAGLMLLFKVRVPLALLMLIPIIVNIVLFHLFLSAGLGLPAIMVILLIIVLFGQRKVFDPVIK